jgi:hypothetical protein
MIGPAALIALAFAGQAEPFLVAQAKTEGGPDLSVRQLPSKMAGKTIAILLISGEEIGVALSEIYANARSVIEANTALTVAPLDVISLDERAQVIRQCAGRGACFAERVRASAGASNVGLLLTVSADRLDEGYLLGFRLVDVETSKDIGAAGDEVPIGMSLLGAMEQQLPGVFPTEVWGQIATVAVESEPPNAEVTIGGRSCVSPCELTRMPPGDYDVTIRKAGYLPWQGTISLVARQPAKVTAQLIEPAGGITSSWIFWTLIGVAVVGGATAAIIATRPSDRVVTICIADEAHRPECFAE